MASLLLLASCAQTHENAEQVDHYPNMYPDYADVTIPVNIAPLNFEIRDKHLTNIETILTIEGADANDADNTLTATSNSQNLKFNLDDWKAFLQKAVNKNVKVQIYSKSDDGEWTAFKQKANQGDGAAALTARYHRLQFHHLGHLSFRSSV